MLMDNYCAMTLGPVCSKTYDLIKKGLYQKIIFRHQRTWTTEISLMTRKMETNISQNTCTGQTLLPMIKRFLRR
ncbi:MAG TPA: hypothetical protein DDW78_06605 [Treponema sp.]|nr:hypothetical protein [Treponema sp.]